MEWKMKSVMIFLLLVCCLCLLPLSAFASIEYHPRFSLSEEYNDNLFLTHTDEEEDWITTVEPGIALLYHATAVELNLDYALRYQNYQNHRDENLDTFEDMQRANATALFFKGRPFTLRISELITRETLDERLNSTAYNDVVNKTTLYHLLVAPEYRWQLTPSFSLVFDYSYDRLDYVAPAGNDSEEHAGKVSFVKNLATNTEISASYRYAEHQVKRQTATNKDYNRQDYSLALSQQFGGRTSGRIEGGYANVEYDDGENVNNTRWLAELTYKIAEPLSATLNYSQDFVISATDGLTKTRSATFSLDYDRNDLKSGLAMYWNEAKYIQITRKDQFMGARANLHLPLAKAFFLEFDADFERAKFKPEDETADRYGIGAAAGIEYRRILATLGYHYRLNNSDIDSNDYQNNVITLSASLRF